MKHDVFVSYASADVAVADAVRLRLEAAGARCFFAPRDVDGGVSFPEALATALESSSVVVVVLSAKAGLSPWVLRELVHAANKGVSIVTFRLEHAPPPRAYEFLLCVSQWVDALPPPVEPHIGRVVLAVRSLLTPAPSSGRFAGELPEDVFRELLRTDEVRTIWGRLVDEDPELVRRELNDRVRELATRRDEQSSPHWKPVEDEHPLGVSAGAAAVPFVRGVTVTKFNELLALEADLKRGGVGVCDSREAMMRR